MKQIKQTFSCKLCGKAFKSAVAVYGHMRCHSKKKSAAVIQKRSVNAELKMLVLTPRKKRSGGRCRIKTSCSNNSSWCNMNTSCCSYDVTVVDEELLDVAGSLLMLSKGGFCSAVDDHVSDNAGESVEVKHRFLTDSVGTDDDRVIKRVSGGELGLNSDVLRSGCDSIMENSKEFDCGLLKNKAEIVEFGLVSDADVQSELSDAEIKDDDGAIGVDVLEAVFGCSSPSTGDEVEYKTDDRMFEESNAGICATAQRGIESELSDAKIGDEARRVNRADTMVDGLSPMSCDPVIEEVNDQAFDEYNNAVTTDKKFCFKKCQNKFVCSNCNRSFQSHQSLGGHSVHCRRLCSVKIDAHLSLSTKSDTTIGEKQLVEDLKFGRDSSSKKRWKHECLVCCRTFPTGRALGGHMRAHYKDKIKSNEAENVACEKECLGAVEEEMKDEENDADGERLSVTAVVEESWQQVNAACFKACNNIQQLLKETQMVIIPQGNIPLAC